MERAKDRRATLGAVDRERRRASVAVRPVGVWIVASFATVPQGAPRRTTVRVGVIAPTPEAPRVAAYLAQLQQSVQPNTKEEYLLAYPGFGQTFGLPLDPRTVASPLVVFERVEVSSVVGSLLLGEASETAAAGP